MTASVARWESYAAPWIGRFRGDHQVQCRLCGEGVLWEWCDRGRQWDFVNRHLTCCSAENVLYFRTRE